MSFDELARRGAGTSTTKEPGKLVTALGRYFSTVLNADADQPQAAEATPSAESGRALREFDLHAFMLELYSQHLVTISGCAGKPSARCSAAADPREAAARLGHPGDASLTAEESDVDSGTHLLIIARWCASWMRFCRVGAVSRKCLPCWRSM